MKRRDFLKISLASSGLALVSCGLQTRSQAFTALGQLSSMRSYGFGELMPAATKNTGEFFLALPKGFEYTVFGKMGEPMSDGRKTPALHDGMACFSVGNELRLIRNHEVRNGYKPLSGSAIGANAYDNTAGGGTTSLVVNPETRLLEKSFVSLSGTLVNCAGGRTPWNSWISCEETTLGKTVRSNKEGGYPMPHGYCFEVPVMADTPVKPVPLTAMGRFRHEAAAVDQRSGAVYLTEDHKNAGFYRFLPKHKGALAEGGILEMLRIEQHAGFDTRKGLTTGQRFTADWVRIDEPDPLAADVDESAVYKQGIAKGAATFGRLEGAYADPQGRVYFTSTNGGDKECGQIWCYEAQHETQGQLTLVFESPSRAVLDMPDNICLQPDSERLFLCEDSDYPDIVGGSNENYIRILSPNGKIADFAKNITQGFETSEFAGATFSPDGKTLFVNLQAVGATFAIWGDWKTFSL